MNVRGAKIQILVMVFMVDVFVPVLVMVMVGVLEEKRADQVDKQPNDRDGYRVVELNREGCEEAMRRLARHEQRDHRASTTALAKPPRTPILPVPKL